MNDHDDQRHSFLAMPINEQMGILYDMLRYVRSEISTLKKGQVEFEEELRDVRRKREARERDRDDDLVSTTEKIRAIIDATEAKRFSFALYLRDKVAPQILTLITVGLLYLVFSRTP